MIGKWNKSAGRGTRFEISTNTRDPSLQLVFADPQGSLTQLGLSIPSAIPTRGARASQNRYLALLSKTKFAVGESARLVGMRQRVLIGETVGATGSATGYPVYTQVSTPDWHFSDGNVSWHLRRIALEQLYTGNPNNSAEMQFLTSDTPSILFQDSPLSVGGYSAPNGGYPPGNVLIPDLSDFHDIRFPWQDDHAWDSLDIEIQGPCIIALYASIMQTNPSTRATLTLPEGASVDVLLPEEQWLQSFPQSIYTRIAGSLIFEQANLLPANRDLVECDPDPGWKSPGVRLPPAPSAPPSTPRLPPKQGQR